MPNRLAAESSPYLLQHAGNPVDWYPWGREAFDKARREDKPIFLSIGYSTCHWCHVMEHESFENPDVAVLLNDHFVPIKVDREERPDVDRVYMAFVQATTGAGGWPMSVWLTPDLRPFFGGTYFPPSSRWGRPGFVDVLAEISRLWRDERPKVDETAAELTAHLRQAVTSSRHEAAARAVSDASELRLGADQMRASFDRRFGGFGPAPKFPRPAELLFLLREHARTGDADLVEMVEATLRAMAFGGMRDHLGGGFHRYSVDREWRVPHFEKMLYDQAQLVLALLELRQATGDLLWGSVAHDTLEYVARDLTHEGGGFFSAEDADSVPPEQASEPGARRSEGAFYIWAADEIDRLMGSDAAVVALRFGVEPSGNAPHDPQGEFGSKNLLYIARSMEEVAAATGRTVDEVGDVLGRARLRLFEARKARPRPHLDDKVLTAWNGLMIAALARAARVLDDPGYDSSRRVHESCLGAARRAAAFVGANLWDEGTSTLRRRYRAGVAGIEGYAEDYAFLVWGLLELFQADGDAAWLRWAVRLQQRQDELFWDGDGGGWYSTTGNDQSVLFRIKDDHDGAEPSATSVSAGNLLTLVHLLGERDGWSGRLEQALQRTGPDAGQLARMLPMMMSVLEAWHHGLGQVVIVGRRGADDTRRLHDEMARRYLPFHLTVPVEPGEAQRALASLMPWVGAMAMNEGRATAYVCRDFACERPVTEAADLARLLEPQHGR